MAIKKLTTSEIMFGDERIRIAIDDDDKVYFNAQDVLGILGYTRKVNYISYNSDDTNDAVFVKGDGKGRPLVYLARHVIERFINTRSDYSLVIPRFKKWFESIKFTSLINNNTAAFQHVGKECVAKMSEVIATIEKAALSISKLYELE